MTSDELQIRKKMVHILCELDKVERKILLQMLKEEFINDLGHNINQRKNSFPNERIEIEYNGRLTNW